MMLEFADNSKLETRRSATAHARSLSRRFTSDRVLTFGAIREVVRPRIGCGGVVDSLL